ncbi:hypothetical protein [Marinomonas shanghaiensis]|uniref:hypothetical protein n=1 Tax=Marinomonas shanghaiensis TaxID=2202418 RepID=UPI000DBAAA7C|nr:hypothetical protein [Marinomonas shanghaiensis]
MSKQCPQWPILFSEEVDAVAAETCYVIAFDDKKKIGMPDLILGNGERLKAGDSFTQLGTKGCSYKNGVMLSDGWYQTYEGIIRVILEDGKVTEFKLFSATHAASGKREPNDWNMKFQHRYLAYVQHENFSMSYFGANYGYHFFETNHLKRFSTKQTKAA